MAEPRPTDAPPLAPAHGGAAQHVAGAPEAPGEKPGEKKDEKPKNTIDEQLNKALEVLKNRESKG